MPQQFVYTVLIHHEADDELNWTVCVCASHELAVLQAVDGLKELGISDRAAIEFETASLRLDSRALLPEHNIAVHILCSELITGEEDDAKSDDET